MKDNLLQLVFWSIALVFGASAEELLPKFLGVGFPILLIVAQLAAASGLPLSLTMAVAVAAGALEDGLSSLPAMTTASYLVLAVSLVRAFGVPRAAVVLTYPCYQLWLSIWTGGVGGGIFVRLLLSLPIGLLTAVAVEGVLVWLKGKAALDESE